MQKPTKRIVIVISSVFLVLALLFGGSFIYLSDYYRADGAAIEAFAADVKADRVEISDSITVFGSQSSYTGFIFYPGGKVEAAAYEPLMRAVASKGILCVLIEMPFNLAVLDMNAADGICESFPAVQSWYIGGHSLGGSMAAAYISENSEDFRGLVLLGSYSTNDISNMPLSVLSVFGSEDKVMNREKYAECRSNMPTDFSEIEIVGGSHAYFGMYGEQSGDGVASITSKEQIFLTADYIAEFIAKGEN